MRLLLSAHPDGWWSARSADELTCPVQSFRITGKLKNEGWPLKREGSSCALRQRNPARVLAFFMPNAPRNQAIERNNPSSPG